VLYHAETRIHGGLESLHHVQKLLHLRLQLDDLLRGGVRGRRRGGQNKGQGCRGQETIAKCTRFLHDSPVKKSRQLAVDSQQLTGGCPGLGSETWGNSKAGKPKLTCRPLFSVSRQLPAIR
jgi:hypothetical protein